MATNKPVFYRSLAEIGRRIPDAPQWNGDSFVTGCNRGVANGAIGINTGDYDPKETDFSRDVARWATPASYIGHYDQAVADMEDRMVGLTSTDDQSAEVALGVGFDTAAADTAALADYGTLPVTNYTGKTIPAGGWAWGFEAAGGDPVAPVVDAGPDQDFWFIDEPYNYAPIQLAGTVTPGTDPNPTINWVILGPIPDTALNTWSDRSSPTTTVKFAGYSVTLVGPPGVLFQLALVVTPNDGPAVVSIVDLWLNNSG